MPTTPRFDTISLSIPLDALTAVTGGCGGKKKQCCPCPPPAAPQQQQAAPQLPPSDNVSVSVNYQG